MPAQRRSGGPDLADYITVAERIEAFYAKYPEGSLRAELIEDDGTRIVMRAFAYRDREDTQPAVGHAEEVRGVGMVNKTSALENAETSAWGRALAALGFHVKKGIASREEVEQAVAEEERQKAEAPAIERAAKLRARIRDLGVKDEAHMKLTSLGKERLEQLTEDEAWQFEKFLNDQADKLAAA